MLINIIWKIGLQFTLIYSSFCTGLADELSQVKSQTIWKPQECFRIVKDGDFVRYLYYGMLENGKTFDSSYDRGDAYGTYVGTGWLIEGMDIGLRGMCVNEQRLIIIPPHLAYGDEDTEDGDIPGGSTILFNVVLIDIWNKDDEIKVTTSYLPSNCERKIEVSDYVRYHYNGTLLNGKKFHSSYDDEQTYNTYVGQGWLIKGMDQGLIGACLGERRTIVIPPHLAYGEKGDGKNIPRSATVVFDVEIIDFHNPKDDVVIKVTKPVENCTRQLIESDFIRYHYNGTLADGTLFDSSYQRDHTYDTYVGYKRVIPGMERGLLGVCMGEWRTITFPPHLGYGEQGIDGKIPGSAVLIFHIYVIDFHNPKDDVMIEVLQKPESCSLDGARKAKSGDYATYDYEVKLMDGTHIDSSKDRTGTWGSYLGKGMLIPGVERGLKDMCIGEVRRVVIPPHIGYGEQGREGAIPGSAVLDFTFHLHDLEDPLPDGARFMWENKDENHPTDKEAFKGMDEDKDGFVALDEFTSFILNQVEKGIARLAPGVPKEELITEMFNSQDENSDGKLNDEELSLELSDRAADSKLGDEL